MEFSNSQKLASVLSEWMRPAISQIASTRLVKIPFVQSLQTTISNSGLVSNDYNIVNDIEPMMQPVIDALITPVLMRYLTNIPDEAIPTTARALVNQMLIQGTISIMDGLVTFEHNDIEELDSLLSKNLPVEEKESYQVIH